MWLINSSIGRKVVMALTGVALVLFLTFHMSMNVVALFSGDAYNMKPKVATTAYQLAPNNSQIVL